MKYLSVLALALVMMVSCKNENQNKEASPRVAFDDFLENYYQEQLTFNPLAATFAGDNRYNDQFPNIISEQYRNDIKGFYIRYLSDLKTYDRASLDENDQISYDVLQWECDINLEGLDFPTNLTPIDQMWSVNLLMGQLASGSSAQPFETVKDYNNWLKRVSHFVVWGDTAIANMKKGIDAEYVLPTSLIEKVIPQIESLTTGKVEDHLFYSPVKQFPADFSDAEKEDLRAAYSEMVADEIIPLFTRMAKFLNEAYLPAGRSTSGIAALKNGDVYYNHQIKLYTTTEMTADEIFELGKSEVVRILAEMEKIKNEVGFKGDIKSFFDYVRNKKELMPFTTADQVLANFENIHERMKPQLAVLFDKVPKTKFQVKRTEAFREASASAEYNPGSLDGTRPGVFYVPIPDAKKYNTYSDESLFLHEAIPGHHYQVSLQQENTNLPGFRRTLWYSAYGEGWALYCESLGKELGLYTDPYQYFGMLGAEMHRAVRLVVDAGMHAKGWTREEAIRYCLENEAESEAGIISEIERYMANPGQALSYKIGQLKIIELRKRAEAQLGDQFDIREFHNIILGFGCVPLEILEAKIDSWIALNK